MRRTFFYLEETILLTIVSTAERQDLVAVTGKWRWETFLKKEMTYEQALKLEKDCATNGELMPTVLALLSDMRPVGMIALCLDDLDNRPELNPWLAGLYVDPPYRGTGYDLPRVFHPAATGVQGLFTPIGAG